MRKCKIMIEEKLVEKSEFNVESINITSPIEQEDFLKDKKKNISGNKYKNRFNLIFILIYGFYLTLFFNIRLFPNSIIQPLNFLLIIFGALISIILTRFLYNFIQFKIIKNSYIPLTFTAIIMLSIVPITVLFLLDPIFLTKILYFDFYSGFSLFFTYIIIIWWILSHQ